MIIPLRTRLIYLLWTLLGVAVLGTAGFAFRGVLLAPTVVIEDYVDGITAPRGMILIRGTVTRAREVYVNGVQVNQSEIGEFSRRVPTFPPYTIIEVLAKDAFGKETRKKITLLVE